MTLYTYNCPKCGIYEEFREHNKWMVENDLIFNETGRIVSKGKTAF